KAGEAGYVAVAGHDNVPAAAGSGTDRQASRDVGFVSRAVVPGGPELSPVGRVVGDGGVVIADPLAGAGDGYLVTVRGDGQAAGDIVAVRLAVVARDPHPGPGAGVVADRDVVKARAAGGAVAGDKHLAAVRADGHRRRHVGAGTDAAVSLGPQLRSGSRVVG